MLAADEIDKFESIVDNTNEEPVSWRLSKKMRSWWRARVDAFELPSTKEVYKYFKHFLLCVRNRNLAIAEEGGEMLDEKTEALNLLNEFLFKSLSAIASSAFFVLPQKMWGLWAWGITSDA